MTDWGNLKPRSESQPCRRRTRFQYGLRLLFLLMTLVAVSLGWYITRVQRQKETVQAILRCEGCFVLYNGEPWECLSGLVRAARLFCGEPAVALPTWTDRLLGKDFTRRAVGVEVHIFRIAEVLPHLKRLPSLRRVEVCWTIDREHVDDEQADAVKETLGRELPGVEVRLVRYDLSIGRSSVRMTDALARALQIALETLALPLSGLWEYCRFVGSIERAR